MVQVLCCLCLPSGSQDSKDGLNPSTKGTDEDKPPAMPEETGKSKVASWLNQGLKTVSTNIRTRPGYGVSSVTSIFAFLSQDAGDNNRCVLPDSSPKQPCNRPASPVLSPAEISTFSHSQVKAEAEKKQDVMTLSDSDDVQTISSGSDDNKEKEKVTLGKNVAATRL